MIPMSKLFGAGLMKRADESDSDFKNRLLIHSKNNDIEPYYKEISAIQSKAIRKSLHDVAQGMARIYGKDIRKVKKELRKSS